MRLGGQPVPHVVLFADKIVNQIKEILRAYVEANESIEADGKIAELRPNESWAAGDLDRDANTLAAYGIPTSDIWASMNLSESDIEKLLKKHKMPGSLPIILALGERKPHKPRFGIFSAKAEF